jgi:hypothetical protein
MSELSLSVRVASSSVHGRTEVLPTPGFPQHRGISSAADRWRSPRVGQRLRGKTVGVPCATVNALGRPWPTSGLARCSRAGTVLEALAAGGPNPRRQLLRLWNASAIVADGAFRLRGQRRRAGRGAAVVRSASAECSITSRGRLCHLSPGRRQRRGEGPSGGRNLLGRPSSSRRRRLRRLQAFHAESEQPRRPRPRPLCVAEPGARVKSHCSVASAALGGRAIYLGCSSTDAQKACWQRPLVVPTSRDQKRLYGGADTGCPGVVRQSPTCQRFS